MPVLIVLITRISVSKIVAGFTANNEVICFCGKCTERMYAIFLTITIDITDF